jgi:glutaredoxin
LTFPPSTAPVNGHATISCFVGHHREAAKKMIEKAQTLSVPVIIIDDKDIVMGFNPVKLDELLSPEKN